MPVDLWTSTPFLDDVTAWVDRHASDAGLALTGEREQPHARPWSSAIRYASDAGPLWFKVNGPGTAHESALVAVLASHVPELGPELVAADPERGWMLMRDAGPVLRSVAEPDELWDRWVELLQRYAAAQLTLTHHVDALLDTGVEHLAPPLMATRLPGLVEELGGRPVDQGGLTAAEVDELSAMLPTYERWCEELAASGVPVSVNHDDLHSSNVCVAGRGTRIIDWGDASVMHPFGTMLATLNSIAWHAGTEVHDPRVTRVRDAYLEPFGGYGTQEDRVRWVGLARRTGCLSRALSYVHALEEEPPAAHEELDWPVRGWLLDLLEQ
jgi:hypothetical protein